MVGMDNPAFRIEQASLFEGPLKAAGEVPDGERL